MAEPWVVFRVFDSGRVVDEQTVVLGVGDPGRVEDIAARQGGLCAGAEDAGRLWMVEVEFWDGEHVRWGTDAAGMVIPVEVGVLQMIEALDRHVHDLGLD